MNQVVKIHHDLGDVVLTPSGQVNPARLKQLIRSSLDQYAAEARTPASEVHAEARRRHGDDYRSPGYYLRLYRQRAGLTQVALAAQVGILQHHLSEMEHNKRSLGKAAAKKLAKILDCDYRKLL